MTSRELAEAIDDLIKIRLIQNDVTDEYKRHHEEEAELSIRKIADAFKRLDHNQGV